MKHMKSPHNSETCEIPDCRMCSGGKMASGGEIKGQHKIPVSEENDNEPSPDAEMDDMVGQEMMEHIHSKNHKGLMESLHAAIAMHKVKDDEDEGPDKEEI